MTATEPQAQELTIEEAAELVAAWIEPARQAFAAGCPVHLTFSPGEGTAYAMSFVPPGAPVLCTEREYPRVPPGDAVLAMTVHGQAIPIAPDGQPYPSYVAEKLRSENAYFLLAVGLCWWLMVGNSPEAFAEVWGRWLHDERRPGAPNPLQEWKREAISGGAFQPAIDGLAAADLAMAISNFRAARGAADGESLLSAAEELAAAAERHLGLAR